MAEKKKSGRGRLVKKIFMSLLLSVTLLLTAVWGLLFAVAHGPSESLRDLLIGMCMQSSAMKFLPYTVLSGETVERISAEGAEGATQVYSPSELENRYITKIVTDANGEKQEVKVLVREDGKEVIQDDSGEEKVYDEWENAVDGIQLITLTRQNFNAYMLIIKDPSRVYVATSSDFSGDPGKRFNEMVEQENCVALMNGGQFQDVNGSGDGSIPVGMVFSKGECVWCDSCCWKTFSGFDTDNKLIIKDNLDEMKAKALNARDGVTFRTGANSNCLIYTDESGSVHVVSSNTTAPAQRAAIGQREDGAVIFLVTDGRSTTSLGANYNDVTQILYEFGAVSAGMLDGGMSAQLYLKDYFLNYDGYDVSKLDSFQKQGLVNKIVTGTMPRRCPTYFCVRPSTDSGEGDS